jgi:hypothetical protein
MSNKKIIILNYEIVSVIPELNSGQALNNVILSIAEGLFQDLQSLSLK